MFVFGIVNMYSQVSVNGSNGADGSYSNLKAAFDAINLQSNQSDKNIVITLSGSTTETASAVLNQPADTSWTSLIIYPTTSGVSISGNIDGFPLIDLNGADKVTIDGRVNAAGSTKDLMISNTSTSNLANTSTIRFINDATNNTVQFCTVSGSETNISSGVIMFSTASVTGNDDNSIINNNLTHAGVNSNRPINIILSIGTATFTNSGILISNNNIYDFLKHATTSNGVYLKDYTTECTVSNNSFYETSAFTAITADANYRIIQINNGSGNKFNVIGNYIGGQSPFCGGSSWTKTARNGTFAAIYINVGGLAGNETTISGNTIANFSWTNSGAANWRGIELNAGKIFLGSSGSQNTIGSQTLPISVTAGASGANTQGIYINSATVDGAYNSVSYIASNATDAAHANNLYGIYKNATGGALTLDNCNISNLTANSLSSANTQILQGIFSAYSGTTTVNITNCTIRSLTNNTTNSAGYVQGIRLDHGSNTVTGNSIYDLIIANPSTSVTETCSAAGIVVYYTTPGTIRNQTISQNTIYNISNTRTNTDFTGMVVGIYYAPNAGNHIVSRNFIHDLSVNATPVNAVLSAIYLGTGGGIATNASTSVISNNLMSIAGNTSTTIYGIYEVGAQYHNVNLFYNTVYISGSLGAGIINLSYCLYSAAQNNTRDFRNNLFFNARSTIGGGSLHYASYYNYANNTNLTNDYNDYFVSGTGGVLGFFNGIDKTDVNITGIEINSKNLDPVFLLAGSSIATDYLPTVTTLNTGASLSVTIDYFGATRSNKTIGALEVLVPVVEVWQSGVKLAEYTSLKNAFDKFNDGTHYAGSFEIKITGNVIETTSAVLNASSGSVNYDHISIYPTGTYSISGSIAGPLIDLNGSDSVVIDGRINAMGSSKDLTIINTSTSPVAGTSTLRLINDASSNKIQFCVLKGSQTCSTSGIVFISTSNMISGNDNNIIDNNQITCASDVNRPLNAIYSSGTLVKENNGLIIRNNNIYNFLSRSSASNGINIFEYTTNSTISGNSFFETASFAPIASVEYAIIRVNNTAGNDFEITNNYIGGDAASCSGVWTKTNAFNNTFYGIYMSVDSIIASKVDGNIIKNLNYSNSLNANWYGLYFNSGSFNIGSIKWKYNW